MNGPLINKKNPPTFSFSHLTNFKNLQTVCIIGIWHYLVLTFKGLSDEVFDSEEWLTQDFEIGPKPMWIQKILETISFLEKLLI